MIFNTGLRHNLAVRIYTVYILTARLCRNPVKYFTDKKSRALAKISQNPASNALQVLELVYINILYIGVCSAVTFARGLMSQKTGSEATSILMSLWRFTNPTHTD